MKKILSLFMVFFMVLGTINIDIISTAQVKAYSSTYNVPNPETAPLDYVIKFKDEKLKNRLNFIISNVLPKTTRTPEQDITVADARRVTSMYGPQSLDSKGLVDLEGIQYFINLEDLRVSGNTPSTTPLNISNIKYLKKLYTLNIGRNNLSQAQIEEVVPNLTELKDLTISRNHVTDLAPIIGPLNKLASLTVELNKFNNIDPIVAKTTTLTYLNLDYNTLTNEELQKLSQLTKLETLFVNGISPQNSLTNIDFLSSLPNLKHLYIAGNKGIKSLSSLLGVKTTLKTLSINSNNFTQKVAEDELSQFTNLDLLQASGNGFYDISSIKGVSPSSDRTTFEVQRANFSTTDSVFPNPIKKRDGSIVPIVETADVINVDSSGVANLNGGYLKINKTGNGSVNVGWNTPSAPDLHKDFTGILTINYKLDSIKPTAQITVEPDNTTVGPVTLTLTASEAIKTPKGWTKTSDPKVFTKIVKENGPISVTITDLAGNSSENPIEFNVNNIDNIGPDITINNPNKEPEKSKEVSASVTEGRITGFKVVPAGTTCDANVQYENGSSVTLSQESDNGKIVCFKAEDDLGNLSFKASDALSGIDTTKPKVTSADADISNGHNNPTINFDGIDNNSIKEWRITIDGNGPEIINGEERKYIPSGLVGSGHVVDIELVDKAGNVSEKRTLRFPPSVKIESPVPTGESNDTISGVMIEVSGPSGMKITDILLGGTLGALSLTCDPSNPSVGSPLTVPFTCDVGDIEQTGKLEVTVTAEGGHTGKSEKDFVIDKVNPELEINSVGAVDTGASYFTNKDSVEVVFTSRDSGGATGNLTTECSIDGGLWGNCSSPYNFSISSTTNSLKVRIKDSTGNISPEREVIIKKDTLIPTFDPTNPSKLVSRKGSPINTLDVTAGDGAEGSGIDDAGIITTSDPELNFAKPEKGNYTITYEVSDKVGNKASLDREVEITDADDLIAEVNKVNPTLLQGKTPESVAEVNKAKQEAENLIARLTSTQQEIDEALLKLQEAIMNLKEADKVGPTLQTPTGSLNPETEDITFSIPEAQDPSGVKKYIYTIEECDGSGTNCTEVVGSTEVPFQAGNQTIKYPNPKKDENRKYILKVKAEDTLGNLSTEQEKVIDTEVLEIVFQSGVNGTINPTTSQKVFKDAPFSKVILPTPVANPGYKFKDWTNNGGVTPPTGTTPITLGTTYTANFEIDQDQKIWNYTVKYYLVGTINPVPGIDRNEDTGTAYIGETININLPVTPTGYKLVSGQSASFQVNSDNTTHIIYYEVDDKQTFSYKVLYKKGTGELETVTQSVPKAKPIVNAKDIDDKTPKGYKLDTANSTTLPHTITDNNATITVSYMIDTSDAGKVFDYAISYLEDGANPVVEIHPQVREKGYIGEVIQVAHTPKTGYVVNPNQATTLTVIEQDVPTTLIILYKKDFDNDGTPDDIDTDDDNDGVSDVEENQYKSDPKNPNSKPQKYTNQPIVKDLNKEANSPKLTEDDVKNAITNKNTFPVNTKITLDPAINLSKLQDTAGDKEVELTVTYPDGSKNIVKVKIKVKVANNNQGGSSSTPSKGGSSSSSGSFVVPKDTRVLKGNETNNQNNNDNKNNNDNTNQNTDNNSNQNNTTDINNLTKEQIKKLEEKFEKENKELKTKKVNGENKLYTLSNKYKGCPMIPNIVGDYNKDFEIKFKDISRITNLDEVQRLAKVDVVNERGVNNTDLFEPNRGITRAEFLAIVLKVHCYDVSEKPESLPFYDVDLSTWQAKVVKVGNEIGIIKGYEKDEKGVSFRPNAKISKIEAFGIMMKMREVQILNNYKDRYTDKKADWQAKPLSAGEYLGIINPENTNFKFNPNNSLTRDEMVKLIVDIVRLY